MLEIDWCLNPSRSSPSKSEKATVSVCRQQNTVLHQVIPIDLDEIPNEISESL